MNSEPSKKAPIETTHSSTILQYILFAGSVTTDCSNQAILPKGPDPEAEKVEKMEKVEKVERRSDKEKAEKERLERRQGFHHSPCLLGHTSPKAGSPKAR